MTDTKPRQVHNSIRRVDACTTCAHVFRYAIPDDPPMFYCTLGATPRPMTWMEAIDIGVDRAAADAAWDAFDAWSEQREVLTDEVCDLYTRIAGK